MKTTILSLLLLSSSVYGQISIDVNDMPSVGDYIPRKSDTMTVLQGPGGSGPNQTWNFTALSNYVINENTSIVSVNSTPNGNQFGASNLAMTNDNMSYLYFNKGSSAFTTQGFSGDLLGTGSNLNAIFNPDLTLHQFPRTFTSSFSDSYGIDVTIPGASINPLISQIHFKRSSVVKDSTDGWGQITTPFGTYDALRVHSIEIFTDSIWAQPIFPPTWTLVSNSKDTTHSYSWLGKGAKLSIAEMSFDSLGAPKIFKWTELPGIGVGLDNMDVSYDLELYPNPFENSFYLDGIGFDQIQIVDLLGRRIPFAVVQLNDKLSVSIDEAKTGSYILNGTYLGKPINKVIKKS